MPRKGRGPKPNRPKKKPKKPTTHEGTDGEKESDRRGWIDWLKVPDYLHLQYLSAVDIVRFDTAMSSKMEREHLMKAYKGLRSPGFDAHVYLDKAKDKGDRLKPDYDSLRWVRKREIDLRNMKMVSVDETEMERDMMLWRLISSKNKDIATYYAIRSGATDIQRWKDNRNSTSTLMNAVEENFWEIAEILVQRGADVNAADQYDKTPLHVTAYKGNFDFADILIGAGANPNKVVPVSGNTALTECSTRGFLKVVRSLVRAGGNVNHCNRVGESALYVAALHGHPRVVSYLIANGADINKRRHTGSSPLDVARYNNHKMVIDILLKAGASEF